MNQYSVKVILVGSEPRKCVNARRSPQGMTTLPKGCNAAVAHLRGSPWAGREAADHGVALGHWRT